MLVAAAVLPHPPLLVPEVAERAADELAGLRAACRKAIDTVVESDLQQLIMVGGGAVRATFGPGARGSLAGFGVPVEVWFPGAAPTGEVVLPLSATIGCWMLREAWPGGVPHPVSLEVVASETPTVDAIELGMKLAATADRVGLLVMGDGSAALTPKAPGYVVEGATEWQRDVDQALGSADVEALASLSVDDAHRFSAFGRAAWQVLTGAARADEGSGTTWTGSLLAAEAPYGVGYTVATWERAIP